MTVDDAGAPYDALPYRSSPLEWTAPERLALVSLLHGGPRVPLASPRVLELGCGDGSNLLALAWWRPHAHFVGIDASATHVALARERAAALGLGNLHFEHADVRALPSTCTTRFDVIVAHGVLSWIPDDARDALLSLHHGWSTDEGLVYVDYNAQPGWSVRGLVRELLLAQTHGDGTLAQRTDDARSVAATLAATLEGGEHPWSRLLAGELRLVAEGEPSYVAHEYLAPYNRSYWRSEFLALAAAHGLAIVADADFDRASGRDDARLDAWLTAEGLHGRAVVDTSDLLRYRQLHAPILARSSWARREPTAAELGELRMAACLRRDDEVETRFHHPRGEQVDVDEPAIAAALLRLAPQWPRGEPLRALFDDLDAVLDDLRLLHRFGVIELRLVEPEHWQRRDGGALHRLEAELRGTVTDALHRAVRAP